MASSLTVWGSNLTTMLSCESVSMLATDGDKLVVRPSSAPEQRAKVNDVIRRTLEEMESYSPEAQKGFELILRNKERIYTMGLLKNKSK